MRNAEDVVDARVAPRYAPAINAAVRASATVRLASTIDAIDPPARAGRPRLWSTLTMLQAL
jgi:hypothetical protein